MNGNGKTGPGDLQPCPRHPSGRGWQRAAGFLAAVAVCGAAIASAFLYEPATPYVAMFGMIGLIGSAQAAESGLGWGHFKQGVALGVGLLFGLAALWLGMCITTLPF